MLSAPTVTALGGSTAYTSAWYRGNPVVSGYPCTGVANCSEPYAYVHLIGSNGLTFDTVVFSQGSTGNFEFDNVAIARTAVTPDPTLVSFPPNLIAGNSAQTATTCTTFSSTIDWTASNFSAAPSYSISPALPAGLTLDTNTGEVSGTPSAVLSSATYTETAVAGGQSATATFTLAVTNGGNLPCPTPTPTPTPTENSALASTGASLAGLWIGIGLLLAGGVAVVIFAARRRKSD